MTIEDNATGGDTPITETTSDNVEIKEKSTNVETDKVEDKTTEGDKPDVDVNDDKDKAAVSDAAKVLAEQKARKAQKNKERWETLSREKTDAIRRADRLETELAQLRGKKAPVAEDYDDVGKLTADNVDYKLDQRRVGELEREKTVATDEIQKARAIAWTERVEDFAPTVNDFENIVRSAPLDDKTSEMVVDLDEGPQVAYHLGKNHAEARRISALPPLEKAVALGRLVERLTTAPPKKITQAAAPIESVGGKSSGGAGFNPEKASVEDFSERYRRMKELGH